MRFMKRCDKLMKPDSNQLDSIVFNRIPSLLPYVCVYEMRNCLLCKHQKLIFIDGGCLSSVIEFHSSLHVTACKFSVNSYFVPNDWKIQRETVEVSRAKVRGKSTAQMLFFVSVKPEITWTHMLPLAQTLFLTHTHTRNPLIIIVAQKMWNIFLWLTHFKPVRRVGKLMSIFFLLSLSHFKFHILFIRASFTINNFNNSLFLRISHK